MDTDSLKYPCSDAALRAFVERAVTRPEIERRPRFYAVTGSHLYGFADAESDIDLCGIHVVPAAAYASLEPPAEAVTVTAGEPPPGVEAAEDGDVDVDLRSYELRKFGQLLAKANYDVLELVLEAPTVMNDVPVEIEALRDLVRDHLPVTVPHSYVGMARSNYDIHLDPDAADSDTPASKTFLYVYRGLLGARYVLDHRDLEADVTALAAAVDGGDPDIVAELITHKRAAADEAIPSALEARIREAIRDQFDRLDGLPEPDTEGYGAAIDDWMRTVRT